MYKCHEKNPEPCPSPLHRVLSILYSTNFCEIRKTNSNVIRVIYYYYFRPEVERPEVILSTSRATKNWPVFTVIHKIKDQNKFVGCS